MPGPLWAGMNSVSRDGLIRMYRSSPSTSLIIDPSMRGDRFATFERFREPPAIEISYLWLQRPRSLVLSILDLVSATFQLHWANLSTTPSGLICVL